MNSDTENNCILIQSKETNNELGLHDFGGGGGINYFFFPPDKISF